MKRHLVFGAVLAAMIGVTTPSWALDVKWGGDYRLRGFYNDNLTDQDKDANDSAAYYSSRFLLTMSATEENVAGVVTLLAGRSLVNGSGNRLLGDTPYGPDGSTDVGMLEAYLKADFGRWAFTGGRKVYTLGHGIVLDDAVDGLWANFKAGPADVTLATLKLNERTNNTVVGIGNTTADGTAGDADLYVLNAKFGEMPAGSHTDVALIYLKDRSAGLFSDATPVVADSDDATVLGLIVAHGGMYQGIHLHGELDYFTGDVTDTDYFGTATQQDLKGMNLTLGAKINQGPIPFGVDLFYASGHDEDSSANEVNINGLNGNYPVGIIITNTGARSLDTKDGTCLSFDGSSLGGSNGCIEGHGLMAVKLSSGVTHGPHVVDVGLIWAQSAEDPDGSGAGNPAGESIGIELDATVTWALTKRLSLLGGIGYLMSGDFFETTTNTDPDAMTVLVTQLSYTF